MTGKTRNKIAALVIASVCLFVCAAGMLVGCDREIEPHDVEVVLINPYTGEPMPGHGAQLEEPPAGTPLDVRIQDLVTGEDLTDEDLPEMTLAASITTSTRCFIDWDNYSASKTYDNPRIIWPSHERVEDYYHVFDIMVIFDCRPDEPDNPSEFQRKYFSKTAYFKFEYVQ